jgi:hypothetical protein
VGANVANAGGGEDEEGGGNRDSRGGACRPVVAWEAEASSSRSVDSVDGRTVRTLTDEGDLERLEEEYDEERDPEREREPEWDRVRDEDREDAAVDVTESESL